MRDSLVKKYLEIADQLQYISYKVDQLISAEKEELRAARKEVPSIPVILDSNNEVEDDDDEDNTEPITEQEPECVDLIMDGDDVPIKPPTIPDPTAEELKRKMVVKVKKERIEENRVANEGAG